MKNTKVKVVYGLLLLLLVVGAVVPTRWLLAEMSLYHVKNELDGWSQAEVLPSLADWNSVAAEMDKVLSLHPKQGEYYRIQGLLYEWRSVIEEGEGEADTEAKVAIRLQTIQAYRNFALLRPASGQAWGNLARQKAAIGQFDDEFLMAFEKMFLLSNYQQESSLLITDVTTLSWTFLAQAKAHRTMALESIQHSLGTKYNKRVKAHIKIIKNRGCC